MKRILLFLILIINRNIFISKVDEPIDINYYSLNNENLIDRYIQNCSNKIDSIDDLSFDIKKNKILNNNIPDIQEKTSQEELGKSNYILFQTQKKQENNIYIVVGLLMVIYKKYLEIKRVASQICVVKLVKNAALNNFINNNDDGQYLKDLFIDNDDNYALSINLIKNFNFTKTNNKDLKELIKILYYNLSFCYSTQDYKNINNNYKNLLDKYKFFEIEHSFDENPECNIIEIQININIYNYKVNLLDIGYNFTKKIYFIRYSFEKNKSIILWYNNDGLNQIDFFKKNTRIFFLYNLDTNNKENKWQLWKQNRNINHEIIQSDIKLDQKQIQTTYDFLKEINYIPTITPVIHTSLDNLNVKLKPRNIVLLKKMNIIGLNINENDSIITLPLIRDLTFNNLNIDNNILKKLIKFLLNFFTDNLYHCKLNIKNQMNQKIEYGNNIYKLNNNEYKNFYFQPNIKNDNNSILINILTKNKNNKYNLLFGINYKYSNQKFDIKYFFNNNHSINISYKDGCLWNIKFYYKNTKLFVFKYNKNLQNLNIRLLEEDNIIVDTSIIYNINCLLISLFNRN